MTHQVRKTTIDRLGGDFDAKVSAFCGDLKAWSDHLQLVAADAASPRTPPDRRHTPYPRPTAHPDIEAAVGENFQPDYTVIDDGPTPDQILTYKKNELLRAVIEAERVAVSAVIPATKERYFSMREAQVRSSDVAASNEYITTNGEKSTQAGIEAAIKKSRSQEDADFMSEHDVRKQRLSEINLAAAKAMHDIEDLTVDNIDQWVMPSIG